MTIHKHTLKENGVKLVSAMENIPDSPEGIILESLLEGMNQYYSAELSQKVLRGLRESYLKGNYTGGPVLFGYDVVDKKNVVNPIEGAIVQEIFGLYAQDYTAAYIAEEMRKRGIRTKKGKYLTEKAIYKMLQNTKRKQKSSPKRLLLYLTFKVRTKAITRRHKKSCKPYCLQLFSFCSFIFLQTNS